MPSYIRPNWLRAPSGRKLEVCTETELREEIAGLAVKGIDPDAPLDDLLLKYLEHLAGIAERGGAHAVTDYLKSAREGFAP